MTVRLLRPEDGDAWIAMRSKLWPECPPERHAIEIGYYKEHRKTSAVFVALLSTDSLVGFIETSERQRVEGTRSDPVGYVEAWFVEDGYRRRGVGRALMNAAEEWALSRGLSELASDADIDNPGSVRAHLAHGFRETFRIVQFVKELRSD